MKRSEAAKVIALIGIAHGAREFTDERARLFEDLILDLDFEAAQRAVRHLLSTNKWLPTVAEIREAATAVTQGVRKTALEVWGELGDMVRKVGRVYGATDAPPVFADPLAEQALRMFGGWNAFCDTRSDEEMSARARFVELYDELSRRQRIDAIAGKSLPAPPPSVMAPPEKRLPALPAPTKPSSMADPLPPIPTPRRLLTTEFQRQVSVEELEAELAKRKTG